MKTGNTGHGHDVNGVGLEASMEPGHEDREYADVTPSLSASSWPQWSPVMKTGNTR